MIPFCIFPFPHRPTGRILILFLTIMVELQGPSHDTHLKSHVNMTTIWLRKGHALSH
jgi:hypothetical protein